MRSLFNISLPCIFAVVFAAPAHAALTIQDAVNTALDKNPTVKLAREKLTEGTAEVKFAWAQVFPTLGLTASTDYQKDALNVGNPQFGGDAYNFYTFALKADQPLYRGGSISSGLGYARKDQELRKYNLEIAERNITIQVIQAFYTVLLNERQVRQYENDQTVQTNLLKEAHRRMNIGRSDSLEILQQETQLALLIPKLITARNQLQSSAATLAYLLEDHEARTLEVDGDLNPVDWQRYLTSVKGQTPHVPELDQIPVAEAQLHDKNDVTMAPYWPSLDAVGTWGRSSYVKADLLDDYSSQWTVGIQLTVPIFAGLASIYERRILSSQEAQLAYTNAQTQDKFFVAQVTAKKNLDTATEVIDPSKKAFDIGVETLKQATRKYDLGTTDYLTFFNTQTAYDQARFSYDQALFSLINAQAVYIGATGLPTKEYVAELVSQRRPQ